MRAASGVIAVGVRIARLLRERTQNWYSTRNCFQIIETNKRNLINYCDFLKFVISIREGHCDYSLWAPQSSAAPLRSTEASNIKQCSDVAIVISLVYGDWENGRGAWGMSGIRSWPFCRSESGNLFILEFTRVVKFGIGGFNVMPLGNNEFRENSCRVIMYLRA